MYACAHVHFYIYFCVGIYISVNQAISYKMSTQNF